MKLELNQIAHIGIVVDSVEKTSERLAGIFATELIDTYDFQPLEAFASGIKITDCRLRIAMTTMKNGARIEIIEAISGDTPHKQFVQSGRTGIHHVAFYTEQFEVCLKYFKDNDLNIIFQAEVEDERGYRRCFYVEDESLGIIFEFAERSYKRVIQ